MNKLPNPGSKEAQKAGCICAVIDNHYGKGMPDGTFWITEDCPLHHIPRTPNQLTQNDMPYIPQDSRMLIESGLTPATAGELNYKLTKTIIEYLGDNPNYQRYNDVVGALECCKLELYRRKISGYEDLKIKTNDDVYIS